MQGSAEEARERGHLAPDALREYADIALRAGLASLLWCHDMLLDNAVQEDEIVRYGLSKVTLLESSMERPDQLCGHCGRSA